MTEQKKYITVLCGGQSAEHEISLLSAANVVAGLDATRYYIDVVYIDRNGHWFLLEGAAEAAVKGPEVMLACSHRALVLRPGDATLPWAVEDDQGNPRRVDCVFPVLHGTNGEDGTVQGLLELFKVPYVGSGVLGSSVCMDKGVAKCLLEHAGLPTVPWLSLTADDCDAYPYEIVQKRLGDVVFVKPANLGSSVGISKVHSAEEYSRAVKAAFQFDEKIIVESYQAGREIECSVLGNGKASASLPGEIIGKHDFYSYEAKYIDPEGAEVVTPAELPEAQVELIQHLAVQAFHVLSCSGMARVDFFVDGDDVRINELNTIPGFTDISMYAKNWEANGLTYSALLDVLIALAFECFHDNAELSQTLTAFMDESRE